MPKVKIEWNPKGSERQELSNFFELGLHWDDANSISIFYTQDAAIKASIFSLGLVCRDLCDVSKNDKAVHFSRLIDNARDYLTKCKSCRYKCKPELAECNRYEQAILRYKKLGDSKVYDLESFDSIKRTVTVSTIKKPTKQNPITSKIQNTIIENYSDSWYIHGRPRLIQNSATEMLGQLYKELTQGLAITNNLTHSYSQVSFVSSNNQLLSRLNESVITINNQEVFIGKVLTLANDRVSRLNFVSALNQQGLEYVSSSKSVIYTCLYSAIKTIENIRLRGSEKFIFVDPLESDSKLEELMDYIVFNKDWLTVNETKTLNTASALQLRTSEIIILDEG